MTQQEFDKQLSDLAQKYNEIAELLHKTYHSLTLQQAQDAEKNLRIIKVGLENMQKSESDYCKKSTRFYNLITNVEAEHRTYSEKAKALENGTLQPYEL